MEAEDRCALCRERSTGYRGTGAGRLNDIIYILHQYFINEGGARVREGTRMAGGGHNQPPVKNQMSYPDFVTH